MRDGTNRYCLEKPWNMSQPPSMTRVDPVYVCVGGSGLPPLPLPPSQVPEGMLGRGLFQEPTCASECLQPPLPPCSRNVLGRRTGHLGQRRVLGSVLLLPRPHTLLGFPTLVPSLCPSVRQRGRREGSAWWGKDSSPLKQPTSSAMLAFSWVAIHSSWVGGKVRAAPEPCCWARPMACMRRC